MSSIELRNKGLINLSDTYALRQRPVARTLIVSGVARSGTSMVARVLHAAGVPMGEHSDDVVFEDHDFAELFAQPAIDQDAFDRLVRQRNEAHQIWGFKRPHLYPHGSAFLSRFRNPLLIVILRDPIAIAERNAIAEHIDIQTALSMAMTDLQGMLRFARQAPCPVLLVSYEKALHRHDDFIARLLKFCGLELSEVERRSLRDVIEPSRPAYIETARRKFDGYIDRIQGTVLSGWVHQQSLQEPLMLTVFRDDVPVVDCLADRYRQDLADAGIDTGRHGFEVPLVGYGFASASRVTVRIKDRSFALNNSGATAAELGADFEASWHGSDRHWALMPLS